MIRNKSEYNDVIVLYFNFTRFQIVAKVLGKVKGPILEGFFQLTPNQKPILKIRTLGFYLEILVSPNNKAMTSPMI